MTVPLKPCPWCGGEPKPEHHRYTKLQCFCCSACNAATAKVYPSYDAAAAAWNTRALEPPASVLQADISRLREALKPFAECAYDADEGVDANDLWESGPSIQLTYGDLRRARAALSNPDTTEATP